MSRKNSPFSKIFTTLTYKRHLFCYFFTKLSVMESKLFCCWLFFHDNIYPQKKWTQNYLRPIWL